MTTTPSPSAAVLALIEAASEVRRRYSPYRFDHDVLSALQQYDKALSALPDLAEYVVVPRAMLGDAIGWLQYSGGNSLIAESERLLAANLRECLK